MFSIKLSLIGGREGELERMGVRHVVSASATTLFLHNILILAKLIYGWMNIDQYFQINEILAELSNLLLYSLSVSVVDSCL